MRQGSVSGRIRVPLSCGRSARTRPRLYKYLLIIRYLGKAYAGWQRQKGHDSIQERLEAAFATITGGPVAVYGAGRTDAGVHALAQAAHASLPRPFEPGRLVRALNGNLPSDIAVRSARAVPADFHARFSARGKRYVYRFAIDRQRPVFGADLCHWLRPPVDLGAMRAAAAQLVGEHDFAAFSRNPGYPRPRGTVRVVHHLHLIRRPRGVDLFIQGSGFLYNMVRAIAGTLQDVGTLRYPPSRVAEILASRDRSRAGMTAPAHGLYLLRVLYPPQALAAPAADPETNRIGQFTDGRR